MNLWIGTTITACVAGVYMQLQNQRLQKQIKGLKRLGIIEKIMEVSSRQKNVFKALKDMNTVILEELQMDYSSFFICNEKTGRMLLRETNLIDPGMIEELQEIQDFRAEFEGEPRDFRAVFEEQKYIWLFSETDLEYPTAPKRGIKSSLMIPLMASGSLIGVWLIEDCRMAYAEEVDMDQIVLLADQISAICMNGLYTYLDPLMKIARRDFFIEFVQEQTEKKEFVVLVFADIDHFKKFNDTYGHEVGDFVLQGVAQILEAHIQRQDLLARFGGEEIVVCLLQRNTQEAIETVEKMRKALEETPFEVGEETLHITASFGVVLYPEEFPGDISVEEMLKKADERLYMAKEQGRNQVVWKHENR